MLKKDENILLYFHDFVIPRISTIKGNKVPAYFHSDVKMKRTLNQTQHFNSAASFFKEKCSWKSNLKTGQENLFRDIRKHDK